MNKKLAGTICCIGIALCMLTGCSKNISESQLNSSLTESSGGDTSSAPKTDKKWQIKEMTDEMRAIIDSYNTLAEEITAKYQAQIKEITDKANEEIEAVYEQILGEQYIKLRNEYKELYNNYQSLVQGFYADGNYTALKDELNAKIAELSTLTKGSAEYTAMLADINSIWSQISVLAGEVNSHIAVLNIRATEILQEFKLIEEGQKDELKTLINPIVSKYYNDRRNIEAAFMRELILLQQTLGLI